MDETLFWLIRGEGISSIPLEFRLRLSEFPLRVRVVSVRRRRRVSQPPFSFAALIQGLKRRKEGNFVFAMFLRYLIEKLFEALREIGVRIVALELLLVVDLEVF